MDDDRGQLMSLWTKTSAWEFLRQGSWFSRQPDWFQSFIISNCEISFKKAGEYLFKTGEAPLGVYGVLSGQVNLMANLPDVDEPVLCSVAEPGTWVGISACLGRFPHGIDGLVACDSFYLNFPLTSFEALNAENPNAYKSWALQTATSYRMMRESYLHTKSYEARQRVAYALVDLLRRVGRPSNGPEIILHIRMNQSEFASLVGVTRQYVSRFIRDLRNEGVLLWRGELIAIKNPARLFEVAGLPYRPGHRLRA